MDPYGGGSQQMMSMSMSSACACVVMAAGGFLLWNQSQPKPTQAPTPVYVPPKKEDDEETSRPSTGAVAEGLYNVKFGGVEMIVNPDTCESNLVGFGMPTESDKGAWQFKAVPNRPGYYYVSSEHRTFKKGCDLKYLTAPSDCKGSPILDKDVWADRQYWQLVPGVNGKYMLKNASCADRRASSYVTSDGVNTGWNNAQMSSREGSPYNLVPWGS